MSFSRFTPRQQDAVNAALRTRAVREALRRGGSGAGRRGGFRGFGSSPPPSLYLGAGGTRTRTTEASYLTGAPTDGSSAFLAWAAINELRIENRGDGLGPMLLMEGARTNLALWSRDLTNAAWTAAVGTCTTTAADEEGPDGGMTATRSQISAASTSRYLTNGVLSGNYAGSEWVKRKRSLGSDVIQAGLPQIATPGSGGAYGPVTLTTAYQRAWGVTDPAAAASFLVCGDGRVGGAFTSRALDIESDLHQFELGAFPSSAIRTTTAAVTRGADLLQYAVGQYPASFLTRGFRFTFAPDFSSAELLASGAGIALMHDSIGTNVLQLTAGSAPRFWVNGSFVDGSALTYSRGQLLTFTVEPLAGRITVSGASAGNGSATLTGVAWPAGTLTIGSSGGSIPAHGRFGLNIVGL